MAADYEEIVSGTVDEVKAYVRNNDDVDLDALLDAERANQDRATLTDWIAEQRDDVQEADTEAEEPDAAFLGPADRGLLPQQPATLLLVGALVGALVAGGAAYTMWGGGPAPTGNAISTSAAGDKVQSFMDQQLDRQRQQFSAIAAQRPNVSADDLSIEASVTGVSASRFGSLREVTIAITGQVPGPTGSLQQLDREQTVYLSADGRYMFPQPTDLDQPQQPQQQPLQ